MESDNIQVIFILLLIIILQIVNLLWRSAMVDHVKYKKELDLLRQKHLLLKDNINDTISKKVVDSFILQRLKKEKLVIKEKIEQLERILTSDLTA